MNDTAYLFMTNKSWVPLQTFASGLEADIAIAQLEAASIPYVRNNNDAVGIVGYGFQGATSKGVTISVPSDMIDRARDAIDPVGGAG